MAESRRSVLLGENLVVDLLVIRTHGDESGSDDHGKENKAENEIMNHGGAS
jgi:hypothetical protein